MPRFFVFEELDLKKGDGPKVRTLKDTLFGNPDSPSLKEQMHDAPSGIKLEVEDRSQKIRGMADKSEDPYALTNTQHNKWRYASGRKPLQERLGNVGEGHTKDIPVAKTAKEQQNAKAQWLQYYTKRAAELKNKPFSRAQTRTAANYEKLERQAQRSRAKLERQAQRSRAKFERKHKPAVEKWVNEKVFGTPDKPLTRSQKRTEAMRQFVEDNGPGNYEKLGRQAQRSRAKEDREFEREGLELKPGEKPWKRGDGVMFKSVQKSMKYQSPPTLTRSGGIGSPFSGSSGLRKSCIADNIVTDAPVTVNGPLAKGGPRPARSTKTHPIGKPTAEEIKGAGLSGMVQVGTDDDDDNMASKKARKNPLKQIAPRLQRKD